MLRFFLSKIVNFVRTTCYKAVTFGLFCDKTDTFAVYTMDTFNHYLLSFTYY